MRYFTKEWYELCQVYGRTFERKKEAALKKQMDGVSAAFQEALKKENLPEGLWEKFFFHDGDIRDIQEGADYIVEVDSPFSEYHKVAFRNAVLKQDSMKIGAVWLYEELYRHHLGYEAHVLSQCGRDLCDTKIICSEILFEE